MYRYFPINLNECEIEWAFEERKYHGVQLQANVEKTHTQKIQRIESW